MPWIKRKLNRLWDHGLATASLSLGDVHDDLRRLVSVARTERAAADEEPELLADDASREERALVTDLREFTERVVLETATPGLSVAVAQRGRLLWAKGFGFADLATRTPMTACTIMRGGSMAKLYTATAVMQLVERGDVDLHAPVSRYLDIPSLRNELDGGEVSLFDLLTFRSGLATDTCDTSLFPPPGLRRYIVEVLGRGHVEAYGGVIPRWGDRVGSRFQYSNLGMAIVGYVIERMNPEGLSYSEYLLHRVLEPLRACDTALPPAPTPEHVSTEMLSRVSSGYLRMGGVCLRSPWLYPRAYPAAGLLTCPADHLKLLMVLQAGGVLDGKRILDSETVIRMVTPETPIGEPDMPSGWWAGLGVQIRNRDRPDWHFGYGGAQPWGWWNESRVYPALDLAVAASSNGWDMMTWHNPGIDDVTSLVCDFAAERRGDRLCADARRDASWGWKVSYLAGALVAERLGGFLALEGGVPTHLAATLEPEGDAAMGFEESGWWNPHGFRAGFGELLASDLTPSGVRAFFASGPGGLLPSEIQLIHRELGGFGELPVPLWFWPHASPDAAVAEPQVSDSAD